MMKQDRESTRSGKESIGLGNSSTNIESNTCYQRTDHCNMETRVHKQTILLYGMKTAINRQKTERGSEKLVSETGEWSVTNTSERYNRDTKANPSLFSNFQNFKKKNSKGENTGSEGESTERQWHEQGSIQSLVQRNTCSERKGEEMKSTVYEQWTRVLMRGKEVAITQRRTRVDVDDDARNRQLTFYLLAPWLQYSLASYQVDYYSTLMLSLDVLRFEYRRKWK